MDFINNTMRLLIVCPTWRAIPNPFGGGCATIKGLMDANVHDSENLRINPNPSKTKTRENKEMTLTILSLPTFLQFRKRIGLQD